MQRIVSISGAQMLQDEVLKILRDEGSKRFMLVCGNSFKRTEAYEKLCGLGIEYTVFSGFSPNPDFSEVWAGIEKFNDFGADIIIAAGGGSAMDTAKAIKMFCATDKDSDYLKAPLPVTGIPIIAIPTTAGTGSESTRFAVIYNNGIKQSIADKSLVPEYALIDHGFLKTLPVYQKKCTLMDALCQAIESWWSVNSNDESKDYARSAIELIMEYYAEYIDENTEPSAERIMLASNLAGRAINITQTTAAHAMSYKLTTVYGLPHGHAVAVCLPVLWRYMAEHTEYCNDPRGEQYLKDVFSDISAAMGEDSTIDAISCFENMFVGLGLEIPKVSADDLDMLANSVNPVRLANNPVRLSYEALYGMYNLFTETK